MNFKQNLFLLNMTKMSSVFCMCFVPVASDNGKMIGDKKSNKSLPLHSPAKNTTDSDEKDKSDGVGFLGRKNKHGRRSLTRYLKAVFFETSMMKKMRSKKLGQKLHRIYSGKFKSKPKSESKHKKMIKSIINKAPREDSDESTRSKDSSKFSSCLSSNVDSSLSSTLSSSSSSSSSMMASGRSSSSSISYVSRPSVTKTVGKGNGKGGHGFSIGKCCLLFISLLVLVIWGKVCAILCTLIVLLFTNRWIRSIKPGLISENIVVDRRLLEIDSELYKKKIIMEGFLERNRSRNLC